MIQFANPVFLWGLLGLTIPVGIHLLSRKEGRVIRVGSLRHVQETSTQQFKSIKLNEIWLLLLRCLLIFFFVMFLSGFKWSLFSKGEKWLLIESGLERESALRSLYDSLYEQGFESRFLADDFPPIESKTQAVLPSDYNGLLEALKSRALSSVVVVAYNRDEAFRGKRMALPANVKWIAKEPTPGNFIAKAVMLGQDSLWIRKGYSGPGWTDFDSERTRGDANRKKIDSVTIETAGSLKVVIVSGKNFQSDGRIMEATLKAVGAALPYKISLVKEDETVSSIEGDWLVWLSESPAPKVGDKRLIEFRKLEGAALLARQDERHFYLTQKLNPDNVVRENLALALAAALFPAPGLVSSGEDKRILSEKMSWADAQKEPGEQITGATLAGGDTILILLAFLTLLVERVVAYSRKQ